MVESGMLDIEEYRAFVRLLVPYACGAEGRSETDPIYQEVTEGRDTGAYRAMYSSCGDLAHWLYCRLGLTSPWVNRAELGHYRVGMNVSNIAYHPKAITPASDALYATGDVLVIWSRHDTTDSHVIVVLDHQPPFLYTGEYGQPGGALKTRQVNAITGRPRIGTRFIQRLLPLAAALELADRAGELSEPDRKLIDACVAYPEAAHIE